MENSPFQRHGDMLIQKVCDTSKVEELQRQSTNNLILGLGEVSGHAHNVKPLEGGEVVELATEHDLGASKRNPEASASRSSVYFEVTGEGALVHHEDHGPQIIEPGIYVRVVQTTYSVTEKAYRTVLD